MAAIPNGHLLSLGMAPSLPPQHRRRRGVTKFFNSLKGFGFVVDQYPEELGGQEGAFFMLYCRHGPRVMVSRPDLDFLGLSSSVSRVAEPESCSALSILTTLLSQYSVISVPSRGKAVSGRWQR